jgi:ABC-type transporter Mla subunit MlaD
MSDRAPRPRDVRDRIGSGNLRARLVRQSKRSLGPAAVIVAAFAVGIAGLVYVVLHVDRSALVSSREVAFAVNDAGGVVPNVDEVRFKGIPAGRITSVKLQGVQPVITVELAGSYGPVYRDAQATLRPNTPLQDMYLDILDRGTPAAGEASGSSPVPASRTDTSVQISDVLDVFSGDVRARLAHLIDDLGNGLADRGAQLRTAFVDLVPFVQMAGNITTQLAANAPLTRQLVHNVAILTTALGDHQQQLRLLVGQGSAALATLQSGAGSIDAALGELPPTLTAADSAFTAVRGVVGPVDGAVSSLSPIVAQLPGSLAAIRRLTARALPAVRALQSPIERLVPLASSLVPVSSDLNASATSLLPQVSAVTKVVDDVGGCLPQLNGFFQWDASMAKFGDARGAAPRGNVVVGLDSSGAISSPFEFAPQACAPGTAIGGRPAVPGDGR